MAGRLSWFCSHAYNAIHRCKFPLRCHRRFTRSYQGSGTKKSTFSPVLGRNVRFRLFAWRHLGLMILRRYEGEGTCAVKKMLQSR
eukprot:1317233-Amorphochlora_amoeboformis.AAC.2